MRLLLGLARTLEMAYFYFAYGAAAGLYVGVVLREEYYFPTAEKVSKAVEMFEKNRAIIEEAMKPEAQSMPQTVPAPAADMKPSGT